MSIEKQVFARLNENLRAIMYFAMNYDRKPEPLYLTLHELELMKSHRLGPEHDLTMWHWLNQAFPEASFRIVDADHYVTEIEAEKWPGKPQPFISPKCAVLKELHETREELKNMRQGIINLLQRKNEAFELLRQAIDRLTP